MSVIFEKPSDAVFAMCRGLKDYKKHNMEIDMNFFLRTTDEGFCFGCAATAAFAAHFKDSESPGDPIDMQCAMKSFLEQDEVDVDDWDNLNEMTRCDFWHWVTEEDHSSELIAAEYAIEGLRTFDLQKFLEYFGYDEDGMREIGMMPDGFDCEDCEDYDKIWHLMNYNFLDQLHIVEAWGEKLKRGGY